MFIPFYILIFLCGCGHAVGHSGACGSIESSKSRGVFVQEYSVNPNPYKINDTLKITVKEAWIEKKWVYSRDPNEIIMKDGFQLCVKSSENDLEGIDFTWTIGISGDKYVRASGKSSLISDFNEIPIEDTIEFEVQQGSNLSEIGSKRIIGTLKLFKKN
jgi:hypothetical protein